MKFLVGIKRKTGAVLWFVIVVINLGIIVIRYIFVSIIFFICCRNNFFIVRIFLVVSNFNVGIRYVVFIIFAVCDISICCRFVSIIRRIGILSVNTLVSAARS